MVTSPVLNFASNKYYIGCTLSYLVLLGIINSDIVGRFAMYVWQRLRQ